jgi:hypothetical protein
MKINKIVDDLRKAVLEEEKRKNDKVVLQKQLQKDKAVEWFNDDIKMWIAQMFIDPDITKVDFGLYNKYAQELWAHAPLLEDEFEDFGIDVLAVFCNTGEWIFISLKKHK